jgi:hypothetical protein
MNVGGDDIAGGLGVSPVLDLVASLLVVSSVDLGMDDLSGGDRGHG